MWSLVTGFFHLACKRHPSWNVYQYFPLFYGQIVSVRQIYCIWFIHLSVDEYLSCFHFCYYEEQCCEHLCTSSPDTQFLFFSNRTLISGGSYPGSSRVFGSKNFPWQSPKIFQKQTPFRESKGKQKGSLSGRRVCGLITVAEWETGHRAGALSCALER